MSTFSDFLAQHESDIVTTLDEDSRGPKTSNIGDILLRCFSFARDEARNLYYYDKGCFHSDAEQLVTELYSHILVKWKRKMDWKYRQVLETIEYITGHVDKLWYKPPINQINLLNGIYNLETLSLHPHTSEWRSTIQIPITYDPSATCKHWDAFLGDVFPEGVNLLHEMLGLLMIPYTRLQKTVLLLGEGSNGKGTFLRAIDNVIGLNNVSHVSLHQMEAEKFSRTTIIGKLVNVFGDLPVTEIKNLNFFKCLVGEDTVQMEYKNKQPFAYRPFARLIFSSNVIPKTNDTTQGYMRRWLIIPFTRRFQVNPKVGQELEENLATSEELSGLLNKVLKVLPEVIDNGFTITEDIANIITNYVPLPENVDSWIKQYLVESPDSFIPAAQLYSLYVKKLKGTPDGEKGFTHAGLTTFIRNVFPNVLANQQKWMDGKNIKCYKGLALTESGMQAVKGELKVVSINSGSSAMVGNI